MTKAHDYFFELLTEEIPAWMLPPASLEKELLALCRDELAVAGAEEQVLVGATSRRIFFHLSGLPPGQADREEEVKGPPRRIAFDAEGKPTAALTGFLKKNNVGEQDITSAPDDDYVRIRRVVKGRTTAEMLTERVPSMIEGIRWPKMMRWGGGEHSYIRPVHSVISLLDQAPLPISIFGVRSGTATVGHRTLSPEKIEIPSWDEYAERLGIAHVVVLPEDRERMMKQRSSALAEQIGGTPAEDPAIWNQWRYLTEFPGVVRSEFDEQYLALPYEVLVTVMRVHQKQLPIVAGENLTNSFLAVMDQIDDPDGNVSSGNAFVTNARFADARFFYETDRKRRLEERIGDLSHLQFQEKLGNYSEKTDRIISIASRISQLAGAGTESDSVQRAAQLSKADLMTEMVKEFTELQGKIGGIYAREEGFPEPVWTAIYDHYLPAATDDPLPRNVVGAIVSLADRIDTLAGFFLLGLRPTGSRDPFALRRAAQGIVQILLNRRGWEVPIGPEALIEAGLEAYQPDGHALQRAFGELINFFAERVRTLLEAEPHGFAYDEVAAAMESGWTNSLTDLHERIQALHAVRYSPDFLSILDSARRIANIVQDQPSTPIDRGLLSEPAEKRLADLGDLAGDQIDELVAQKHYRNALESFAGLAPELENFFNEVMVMVDDPEIRSNRIALLRRVGNSVQKIADVTKIVIDRSEYRPEHP